MRNQFIQKLAVKIANPLILPQNLMDLSELRWDPNMLGTLLKTLATVYTY